MDDINFKEAKLDKNEQGASLVEYALLVALIAVACIVAIQFLQGGISQRFSAVGSVIGAT